MILQRVESPDFLSNAYFVCDEPGGTGVLIDANGVVEPLLERVDREGTEITHVLLTHHHWDHVIDVDRDRRALLGARSSATRSAPRCSSGKVTDTIDDGDVVETGGLRIEAIHTPGHCADHLALRINDTDVLTADVLFKGTVGGTRAPGATGFEDLKSSVMDKLMKLPPETRVHPGHKEPTTIGDEWESNPFIAIWRGEAEESSEAVSIGPADAETRERGDAGALGAGLRRRQQGLGPLRLWRGRDRRRLPGQARVLRRRRRHAL